uniref:Uncharacterized protein n=1 Tax=Cryptomonas curvata TaxID=233186 RepID=A0A7S0QFZ5_9CRYP
MSSSEMFFTAPAVLGLSRVLLFSLFFLVFACAISLVASARYEFRQNKIMRIRCVDSHPRVKSSSVHAAASVENKRLEAAVKKSLMKYATVAIAHSPVPSHARSPLPPYQYFF